MMQSTYIYYIWYLHTLTKITLYSSHVFTGQSLQNDRLVSPLQCHELFLLSANLRDRKDITMCDIMLVSIKRRITEKVVRRLETNGRLGRGGTFKTGVCRIFPNDLLLFYINIISSEIPAWLEMFIYFST